MAERKSILLRLDPAVHDALAKWAADEMRSTNAQIEFLLRRALGDAGRMPRGAGAMRRPGRPTASTDADGPDGLARSPASSNATDESTGNGRCRVKHRPVRDDLGPRTSARTVAAALTC
jgi:hypothetical protein